MHEGNLQRLIHIFKESFDSLEVEVPLVEIEDLAVLIYKGMTVQARNYHNLDHVFSLTDTPSTIIKLSALFHDLVYCQVDHGFLPEIKQIIDPYVREDHGRITIREGLNHNNLVTKMLLRIFNFYPGQMVGPKEGLNEFLSALVMVEKLGSLLSEQVLTKLVLCIEATIPFRESAASGTDYFYSLEQKAIQVNESMELEFSLEDLHTAIHLAVEFANRDVESFAEPDVSSYLETTWKLIPELNFQLRSIETYSIREYRQALQAMQTSMDKLNPNSVFHQYRGLPADEVYWKMLDRANMNIQTGQEYLHIKLLTQAILEALAEESGGDAPLSLFMGDLPSDSGYHRRIEDFLPFAQPPAWINISSDLYRLLSCELNGDATFDLCTAPLSLFVYKQLSPELVDLRLNDAYEMFAGRLKPFEFLDRFDPALLGPIANASVEMVMTRREQLGKFSTGQ